MKRLITLAIVALFSMSAMAQQVDLRKKITEELKGELLITPKVDLVEPDSIPKGEGKAIRVIDNRKD